MTDDRALQALYEERVRGWARRVRDDVRLAPADLTVSRTSPACGSTLTLDVRRERDRIAALGYRARACTLGMASTAVVAAQAVGERFEDALAAGRALAALLAGEDARFEERWRALDMFVAARGFPSRHGSILLPFHALTEAAARLSLPSMSAEYPHTTRS
ncbi:MULTISPECIES: iron-sulfur cluster assembly scaffold protein [Methylosinus]|uniref:Iron-sulfur cluster assembly scaffold protein n=1 Tax=Methylosinus trichosporium (strain ATCC 35070 / NCIMB 11131 / UNIQEM 75 / OB3b) TaxID=595536 RepID=A0A2D2D1L3_METT3|nr:MULTISPECIES: iron-sulfur cluster assembly scaffold protein [Methylosinus]ATQ68749.1 iron-sulfur cluster assembly scaffold protein [Methylosinus trichosporium OB3b]OBS53091.1 iron-sulfur cluster assembly scaffold protein [Methylosinus sp. 3S-1]